MKQRLRVTAALLLLSALTLPGYAADRARAEEIVQGKCFVCHGANGESSTPLFPRLSGQHAAYVARQLADYKSGRRKNPVMQSMVDDLSQADFLALGAYFESQAPVAHAVDDADLAAAGRTLYDHGKPGAGVAACASCHGPTAAGTEQLPRLAGQHAQYTQTQLRQFSQRRRTNDNAVMQTIARKLTEPEIKAVAAYLSGLK